MAKIGVYIPEDRMKDIELWRETLNFSQLFMEAFDRAITAHAHISNVKGKEMQALIQRLKRESSKIQESGWKAGVKEGKDWAIKYAYVTHIREIAEGKLTFRDDFGPMDFLYSYYACKGYYRTPEDEHNDAESERDCDMTTYRQGFNRGFVEVVTNIWEDIKPAFEPDQRT